MTRGVKLTLAAVAVAAPINALVGFLFGIHLKESSLAAIGLAARGDVPVLRHEVLVAGIAWACIGVVAAASAVFVLRLIILSARRD